MSVTEGNVKPFLVPRIAPIDLTQADLLKQQEQMTSDPNRKKELKLLAALESRYAQQSQAAQQLVQDAALSQNPIKPNDIIMGGAWHSAAKLQRGIQQDRAAVQYNTGLPAGYMGQRKNVGNPFYGA